VAQEKGRKTMQRNRTKPPHQPKSDIYDYPIISGTLHRDTLNRVADVIKLLEQLDLSDGLTPSARAGLYWIHHMLADAIKHVSDGLRRPDKMSTTRYK
jgi:hypothetical protein